LGERGGEGGRGSPGSREGGEKKKKFSTARPVPFFVPGRGEKRGKGKGEKKGGGLDRPAYRRGKKRKKKKRRRRSPFHYHHIAVGKKKEKGGGKKEEFPDLRQRGRKKREKKSPHKLFASLRAFAVSLGRP